MIKDSVFSEYLENYFPNDRPISSEKAIASELDEIELPTAKLISKSYDDMVKNAVIKLQNAIASGDKDSVKNYKWTLNIFLANNLWGEWLLGWQAGKNTGDREIYKKADFAQSEAEPATIRNRPAEEAIKARINTLAKDVSDSEWTNIKQALLDTIQPQSETQPPISRKELLKRINEQLGDRAGRFKKRAETIARTELTFAYNAGRLESYVNSGLVSGVRYQTIFDERRCEICKSRQGIIVALDDFEGLARLAIPAHPRCRCVWSPILKEEFEKVATEPKRQIKNRKIVPGKSWLAGGILAAILIPEELAILGAIGAGIKALISKTGSLPLARVAIADKINKIIQGIAPKPTPKIKTTIKFPPQIIAPNLDLNQANPEQLRSLIPNLTQQQIEKIIGNNINRKLNLKDLKSILSTQQYRQVKAIARENYLLNLLHPNNNLNPSAIWVNSGGIISKKKAKAVFKLIKNNSFDSVENLLEALRKEGIDYIKLNNYALGKFDLENR